MLAYGHEHEFVAVGQAQVVSDKENDVGGADCRTFWLQSNGSSLIKVTKPVNSVVRSQNKSLR